MGCYLGTSHSTESAVVRDNIVQGVMPESPESLKGHNSVNTCSNGASEESIDIYSKNRCQWTGCLIKKSSTKGDMVV